MEGRTSATSIVSTSRQDTQRVSATSTPPPPAGPVTTRCWKEAIQKTIPEGGSSTGNSSRLQPRGPSEEMGLLNIVRADGNRVLTVPLDDAERASGIRAFWARKASRPMASWQPAQVASSPSSDRPREQGCLARPEDGANIRRSSIYPRHLPGLSLNKHLLT